MLPIQAFGTGSCRSTGNLSLRSGTHGLEPYSRQHQFWSGHLWFPGKSGSNFENGRALQQAKDREDRWLSIYRDITSAMSEAVDALGDLSAYTSAILNDLRFAKEQGGPVAQEQLRSRDAKSLADLKDAAGTSITRLVETIERNELAKPELGIFKLAFSVAVSDLTDEFWPLYNDCLIHLPMNLSPELQSQTGMDKFVPPLPSDAQFSSMESHKDTFQESIDQVRNFIFDLGIEAQNHLLSSLFENRLPKREPIDPKFVVIVTEPEDAVRRLREHFEKNTRHGRRWAEAERAARKAVHASARK